jgi:UDP-N-acetylmuramoylalanine--D-glutamate ligase
MVDTSIATQAKTLIVGLGMTGLSVARHLALRGEPFAVADTRPAPPALAALRKLDAGIQVHLGPLEPELLARAVRVVVSPGVSVRTGALQGAIETGVQVMGDVELFARATTAPIAAITGSNGKSTVTTLLAAMARQDGRLVRAGGNLGRPALDLIEDPEPDLYVLELSSFQLETTFSLRPTVAVVLNVSADHMDRYATLEDYAAAKARVYSHAGTRVVNRDDPVLAAVAPCLAQAAAGTTVSFGLNAPAEGHYGLREGEGRCWLCKGFTRLIAEDELRIPGRHNTANALAALALGGTLGLSTAGMNHALKAFCGLPHRMQWVAERDGINWYNDSKGTNVGATLAALSGMPGPMLLIAGGEAKGADFTPLRSLVQARVRSIILIGRDAQTMAAALAGVAPVIIAPDMEAAVAQAVTQSRAGDRVLLSPACSSLDMYNSYAERGDHFMSVVRGALA